MPVKPLSFKGDKSRPKKRKHRDADSSSQSTDLVPAAESSVPQDEDDSWVHPDSAGDLSGPLVVVLSTRPPTCLASDAHGNVFASPVENIVDDNPVTAEPHDVRQVWVATRVAGMGEGRLSLKGSHGGYLSCDEIGTLGARREARGFEEDFLVEPIPSEERSGSTKGEWRIRAVARAKDKPGYLSAVTETTGAADEDGKKRVSISLRGDGEKENDTVPIVLKMQARFKPKLQKDKEQKKSEKVSRSELERVVGRRLDESEVKRLKKAKREGTYHEEILDVRVKGKHDKFA